jgi:hypothetical protein
VPTAVVRVYPFPEGSDCMVCPTCGNETRSRLAIVDPNELKEEKEYCLTCEKFVDDNARLAEEETGE